MKTLRELHTRQVDKDAEDFGRLAHFILRHRGSFSKACMAADGSNLQDLKGLTPRLVEILRRSGGNEISRAYLQKAAANPSALAGGALQDVSAITSGFINSLASFGAFDRILADNAFREIPLRSGAVGAITVGATGYQVNEAGLKPISRLSVTGTQQNPLKAHVAVVVTQELARSTLLASGQLIQRELQNSVATATDSAFISSIIAGVIPASSYGSTASNVRSDIDWLLRQVSLKQTSRPYLITTSAIAGVLSQKENGGLAAFPGLGPQGGSISQIPVLISDAVPLGYLILVDASQIAAAGGEVALEQVEDGILQLDTAPDSPPTGSTPMVGLWQLNLTGIRAERFLIATKLTPTAVAIINNPLSYVVGAGSP